MVAVPLPDPVIASDILGFLARHESKELLRFVIVGSVDDGKSTLVGRLLFELGAVYEDQLDSVRKASKQVGVPVDFSLITDGLEAEREQGITIDVAYRYFTTAARKFIVADTPGHVQYTRNMVTGASTADVGVILIDARLGVLEQSRRHATIAALLGIPHLLVAVNKMDLVDWDRSRFEVIERELRALSDGLSFKDVTFVPVSALCGDNVVQKSARTPWYAGPTVLHYLESVPIAADRNLEHLRFPVQVVLRPTLDYRGFAGQLASGVVKKGDEVLVLPSGRSTRVVAIDTFDGEQHEAFAPQSVTLRLADELDCSRGDMIVHPGSRPRVGRSFDAQLVWLHEQALDPRRTYLLKHTTHTVRMSIDRVHDRIDLRTLTRVTAAVLELNDIGRVTITCHRPLFYDAYADNRGTGSFIVIDALSGATVAAGLIIGAAEAHETKRGEGARVTAEERRARLGQSGVVVWITDLEAHRGLTLAHAVERRLFDLGHLAVVLEPAGEPVSGVALTCRSLVRGGLVAIRASATRAEADLLRLEVGAASLVEVSVGAEGAPSAGLVVDPEEPDVVVDRIVARLVDGGFLG
jgi:sulfate adenylyltransferase large subunit